MKKTGEKILAILVSVAIIAMLLPQMEGQEKRVEAEEATATEITVSSYDDLLNAVNQCSEGPVIAKLSGTIEITKTIQLTAGDLTVDLSSGNITGEVCFFKVGSDTTDGADAGERPSLTIKNGNMTCTGETTAAIEVSGGDLDISDMTLMGDGKCIVASDANVDITGNCTITGMNTSGETLSIEDNCTVNVNTSAYCELCGCGDTFLHVTGTGNTINIEGESKISNQRGLDGISSGGTAVLVEGTDNQVNINGGTLCSQMGDALVLGSELNDEDINISGGTFEVGDSDSGSCIVRKVPAGTERNYFTFYGDESRAGIIAKGYVLTENTFTTVVEDGEASICTYDSPQNVFKGCLVELQSGRSTLEEYTDDETAEADEAEYYSSYYSSSFYSLAPVSIAEEGTVYGYFTATKPVIDTVRVTNGNTYTFRSWCDDKGNEYASVDDFIATQSDFTSNKVLHAVWDTEASTADGLADAMLSTRAVKDIELTGDLSMTSSVVMEESEALLERTLDLGNHTISSSAADGAAFVLSGSWNIQNGAIDSDTTACIQVNGTAVLDNLNCKSKSGDCVVEFSNVTADSSSKILPGTYETGNTDGYAIKTVNGSGTGTAQDITNLFGSAYASTTKTIINGANVYLDTTKLLVSQTPITYIEEKGADISLGTYTYGDQVEQKKQTISNQEYVGDIVITSVSADNTAFEVTGETGTKTLPGGSEDTYSYTVGAADKTLPGNYEGTISVHYTKMDGTESTYQQTVSMVITPKELQITDPVVNKTKTYDGTVAAEVTPGTLQGVIEGDDVSVTAVAEYDNVNAGTGRTITVTYTLTGEDKDGYQALEDVSYTDGVITARQLTIEEPSLTKTKTYDKTTVAKVTAGELKEVVTGDDVAVEATAVYDSASVGTGKPIMVKYTLTGADKANYIVPANASYTDGVITAKQLTVEEPTLTKTKTYDGTTTAQVKAGALNGVIAGEDVSVEATAVYDNANAGTGKTIMVSYTLTGTDKENYIAPIDTSYTDGVIKRIDGTASATMESYYVGEKAPEPKAESKTNAGAAITFYYKEKSAADTSYSTTVPTGEGNYTVKAVFAEIGNYNAVEATADFSISYIDTPKEPYSLVGTKGNNGWYASSVTIYPAAGYLLSEKQDGEYKNSYLLESTQSPVLYLKDGNGAVTKAIQVETIQIDTKKPTISGIADGEVYYEDELKAVVSDDNLESVTLNGKAISVEGTSMEITLKPSLLNYVLNVKDKAGNQAEYTFTVEEAWMKQGIISSGIKNLVTKKSYKLGTGTWKVSGDNTVYQGGINIYAASEGSYDFQKQ